MNTLKNVHGKTMENKSKTFCVMPFVHQNLKQEGRVTACWRAQGDLGNNNKKTLTEIFNSEETKELRRAVLNNERPEGCRSCWDAEDSGVDSTRLQTLTNWDVVDNQLSFTDGEAPKEGAAALEQCVLEQVNDDYSFPIKNLKSIEVRFDNICNLMCRHCSPDYSSKWEAAVKKDYTLMNQMRKYGTYRKSTKHVSLTDSIIDEVVALAPNLKEILIAGGEPLYHDKHYDFIEKLLPYAKNIKLSYNTNLTTLTHKGKNILDLWKKFKKVEVRVSIDADPSCYSYVRTNNDLNNIEQNIFKVSYLKNVILSATCTTSMLNITRFPAIAKYFNSLGVKFHCSIVQYPECLNPKVLPAPLKQQVTTEWNTCLNDLKDSKDFSRIQSRGQKVIDYMNSQQLDKFDDFIEYSKSLDKYHNTNLFSVYPEFKPFTSSF